MNRRSRGSSSSSSGSVGGASDSYRRRSDVPRNRSNDNNKGGDSADVSFIVGTCSSMCPGKMNFYLTLDSPKIEPILRLNCIESQIVI